MRKKAGEVVLGLLFVAVGVLVAGKFLFNWEFTLFFKGWWTLFIIVPCIASMISGGINVGNTFGVGIGVILFMGANNIFISMRECWQLIVPLLLVLVGVSIIFRRSSYGNFIEEQKSVRQVNGIPEYTAVFSGNGHTAQAGEIFNGANSTAVFGGIELKLQSAVITEDIIINCSTVFGGTDIYLPSNVKVKVTSTPIFGGVDNKRTDCVTENAPTVYVNATCIFGGVDVH